MRATAAPLSAQSESLLDGLYLVTEDDAGMYETVLHGLEQRGAFSAVIPLSTLRDPSLMGADVNAFREKYGPVSGIVHLAGLTPNALPESIEDWKVLTQIHCKSLFHLLQHCGHDLQEMRGTVLSLSALGGHFGRRGARCLGPASSGGSAGLLKTMALERPGTIAKVIDLRDVSAKRVTAIVLNELVTKDGQSEIGYENGSRFVFDAIEKPTTPRERPVLQAGDDWVVLALGGARGITAEILDSIIVPGMRLLLVGRSSIADTEESSTLAVLENAADLRRHFLEAARSRGEKPTPVEIERCVERVQRDRDVHRNIDAYWAKGATVEFHSVDLRDAAAFASFLDGLYERFGRIDAVIQGAGLIEDKLIADKTTDSFNRVFDTKADSTFVLARHLRPESLKLVILFSSIAGRTGNRGQCDYAAANEVMNRLAWWMRQEWPHARVISLNWGPWDVTGMASDEVKRRFRERGVIPIPPEAGRQFVQDELAFGDADEVEVIPGIFEQLQARSHQPESTGRTLGVIMDMAPVPQSDGTALGEKRFSLESDPYLEDHIVDGNPVVPAAVAAELGAEFVRAAWPERLPVEIRDLKVFRGLLLEGGGELHVRLVARPGMNGGPAETVVEITCDGQRTPNYRMTVVTSSQLPIAPRAEWEALSGGDAVDVDTAYREHTFHGPRFQCIREIEALSEAGIDAWISPSDISFMLGRQCVQEEEWLFDPGIVDACLQTILVMMRIHRSVGMLPLRFGSVRRYQCERADGLLKMRARVSKITDTAVFSDYELSDAEGNLVYALSDVEGGYGAMFNRLIDDRRVVDDNFYHA